MRTPANTPLTQSPSTYLKFYLQMLPQGFCLILCSICSCTGHTSQVLLMMHLHYGSLNEQHPGERVTSQALSYPDYTLFRRHPVIILIRYPLSKPSNHMVPQFMWPVWVHKVVILLEEKNTRRQENLLSRDLYVLQSAICNVWWTLRLTNVIYWLKLLTMVLNTRIGYYFYADSLPQELNCPDTSLRN